MCEQLHKHLQISKLDTVFMFITDLQSLVTEQPFPLLETLNLDMCQMLEVVKVEAPLCK